MQSRDPPPSLFFLIVLNSQGLEIDEFYTANLSVYFWLYGAGEGGKKGTKWSSDLKFSVFSVVRSIQMPALGASPETDRCVFK